MPTRAAGCTTAQYAMRSSKRTTNNPTPSAAVSWQGPHRTRRERWFAGLTWHGVAMIVLLCALNAFRRKVHEFFLESLDTWLLDLLVDFGTGLLMASLITLAVVATYNRVPSLPRFRYPGLVLAIALSAAAGEWIKLA